MPRRSPAARDASGQLVAVVASVEAPEAAPAAGATTLAFRIPVGVVEGYMTSDHRRIEPGALVVRPLPQTLHTMEHQAERHDDAFVSGTVRTMERIPGDDVIDPLTQQPYGPGTFVWVATGDFIDTEQGRWAADRVADGSLRFISVDLAGAESDIVVTETDEEGWPVDGYENVVKGELGGFTQVAHPAFAGAYIELALDEAQPVPELPAPTPEQAASGLVILSDEPGCEPCRSDPSAVVAAGGPLRPPSEWFADPRFTVGDGRLVEQPSGNYACPLTITDDGRVFGHVAAWGTCHMGLPGQCLTPQRSPSGYSLFHVGAIRCADGSDLAVGHLTFNANHAPIRDSSGSFVQAAAAIDHYAHTAAVFADVRAGEDEYGIWVAGALRPGLSEQQVRTVRGASLSGDWRRYGAGMEMVAALAVNLPGYPIARAPQAVAASGVPRALVASGVILQPKPKPAAPDLIGAAIERALRPVYAAHANAALARIPRKPR